MSVDLTGTVAVVTGAGGRLGPIWVSALLRAGAHVLGLDVAVPSRPGAGRADADVPGSRRAAAGAAGVNAATATMVRDAADSHENSGRFLGLAADVTDRQSLERSLGRCLERLGPPTVLVNNAGIDFPPSKEKGSWTFEDFPEHLSAAMLDVNVLGVLRTCQVYGPVMAREGRGSIINIGSLYGNVAPNRALYDHIDLDPPFLKPATYGISKAGVSALGKYLATLWGTAGVRVNTLSPGGVLGEQDRPFREKFTARVPLGRMALREDLTGPLLFLASDLSRYVTGHELIVDGGYVCW